MTSPPTDKEIEIIHELGQRMIEQETMLNQASDACGKLDWSVTMQTTSLYSLTILAFSRSHKGPECTNSPDQV